MGMNKYERALVPFRKNAQGFVTPVKLADLDPNDYAIPDDASTVAAVRSAMNTVMQNLFDLFKSAGVVDPSGLDVE